MRRVLRGKRSHTARLAHKGVGWHYIHIFRTRPRDPTDIRRAVALKSPFNRNQRAELRKLGYDLAAFTDLDAADVDEAFLAAIASSAITVTLAGGERTVQDVVLGSGSPGR